MTEDEDSKLRLQTAIAEWESLPSVLDILPIQLPSGTVIKDISCSCNNCSAENDPEDIHIRAKRPVPDVVVFEGWSFCSDCGLLTPFLYRVRGQGLRLEWEDPEHGWVSSGPKTANYFDKLKNTMKRLVGFGYTPPKSNFVEVLKSMQSDAARDILASGWADAVDSQLAVRGIKCVGADSNADHRDSVVLICENSITAEFSLHPLEGLDADDACEELGPVYIAARRNVENAPSANISAMTP